MEIGSSGGYPASALSNFAPHAFVFDGVACASMEGLLQSFKFDDRQVQVEVCALVGRAAKRRGQERNEAWKSAQVLWWNGAVYERHSQAYQRLLDRAFGALAENEGFYVALRATGDEPLAHAIGNPDPYDTVLTEYEFCSRLMCLRARLVD